jgi:radical SAM superfamily enzyme YgiQ (UPF0313 family)
MNIFFLNPNWNLHQKHFEASIPQPIQPLEFAYMASQLRGDHTVRIYDAHLKNSSLPRIVEEIKKFRADVVVLETAPTYLFWRCCPLDIKVPSEISKLIKKKTGAKLICIGPHPTITPSWTMKETKADYLVMGEPDISVPEFIKSEFDTDLKGVYTSNGGDGVSYVEDLSKLPLPSFDLLEMRAYSPYGDFYRPPEKKLKNTYAFGSTIEYSRGCIFDCIFCFREGFRREYRTKKVRQLIREIKYAKEFGVGYFYFIDELFNKPGREIFELLEKLEKEDIKFGCQCRPDLMTVDLLERMKDAGCVHIEYGLESVSEEILGIINKNTILEKVKKIISQSKDLIDFVVTFRMDFNTMELKKALKLSSDWTGEPGPKEAFCRPYPNTKLYNSIKGLGYFEANPWIAAQKYMWHVSLEKKGINIPPRFFYPIPFAVLEKIFRFISF